MSTSAWHSPYHDFTLDELEAYDRSLLEPERVVVIDAHLAAGCPACRRWLAGSDEAVRLIEAMARDALSRSRPTTGGGQARAWGRRRIHARRLTVLLYAMPLKAVLVAVVLRADRRRGTRLSAAVGIAGLTVGVLRHVLTPPDRFTDAAPSSQFTDAAPSSRSSAVR